MKQTLQKKSEKKVFFYWKIVLACFNWVFYTPNSLTKQQQNLNYGILSQKHVFIGE
jgi:hypothetical protein